MRLFDNVRVLRGSMSWGAQRAAQVQAARGAVAQSSDAESAEFDEDGRLYAFRFRTPRPEPVIVDRDRLFEYARRRRRSVDGRSLPLLPDEAVRSYVRDLRNRADFFADVRELQTHLDVVPLEQRRRSRLRAVREQQAG